MPAFGPFVLEDTGELRRDGRLLSLQAQPARVLRYLAESGGRLVSRDELVRYIWPEGHHVDYRQGLNYCIRQIRIVLEDDVETPRYLVTVPRRGYKWIAAPARRGFLMRPVPMWSAIASAAVLSLLAGPTVHQMHRLSHVALDGLFQKHIEFPEHHLWHVLL